MYIRSPLGKVQSVSKSSLIAAAAGAPSLSSKQLLENPPPQHDSGAQRIAYRICLGGMSGSEWIDLPLCSRTDALWASEALADACSEVYQQFALWEGPKLAHYGRTSHTVFSSLSPEQVTL